MSTDEKNALILEDIPKLYDKIDQCNKSIEDYELHIDEEELSQGQLSFLIREDEERKVEGKRTRYDIKSLRENITRHDNNIVLFKKKIEEEKRSIERFKGIIKVLREDLERPNEIVIDLRQKAPDHRNID